MALRSLSLSSGIAGTPCQFSSRQSSRGSCVRKNVSLRQQQRAGLLRIWAQEEGQENSAQEQGGTGDDEDFEARLARLQRKVTSGTGKKAEARKARKEGGGLEPMTSSSSSSSKDLFIPPVPLKEPVADGLLVELGMKPYVERLNGRLAALGLAAVLLVELATGDSFIKFHDSGTIFVQVYTVVGLACIYSKLEKERISVWPK